MNPSLDGPRAKIERSKKHFGDLHNEMLRVASNVRPYRVVVEREPDAREHVIRIRGSHVFPLSWSAIAGDAVHNLRAALDLLVCQLVLTTGKRPDMKTEFPIFLDAAKYKAGSPRKVKGASKTVVEIIESLQPYHKTGNPESHPLWLLHRLDIRDKHQLLNIITTAVQTQRFEIDTGGDFLLADGEYRMLVSPVEDGTELGQFTLTRPDAKVNVKPHVTFEIAFDDFGVEGNFLVYDTIDTIGSFVRHTVDLLADQFK